MAEESASIASAASAAAATRGSNDNEDESDPPEGPTREEIIERVKIRFEIHRQEVATAAAREHAVVRRCRLSLSKPR
jgi:hypothetical protein